jgi:hypothetical protein
MHDADEKDRHRCNRGGAPRLSLQSSNVHTFYEVVPRGPHRIEIGHITHNNKLMSACPSSSRW